MKRSDWGTVCAALAIFSGFAACSRVGWEDKPTAHYGATLAFAIRNNLPFLFFTAALLLFGAAVLLWWLSRERR